MEFKALEMKDSAVDLDARTFEGYASTWDEDLTGDIIHQGAFKKSILEDLPTNRIKVLWQHNQPLGMPTEMREDSYGLFVKGRVSKTILGNEALELMKDNVVDRMSIGFTIPNNKFTYDEDGKRHINEIKLMEFSPVTFPANENAVITGVKSLQEQILVAKSKGVVIQDSAELQKMFTDLKALLNINEPPQGTHDEIEPLIGECKNILIDLGDFAKQIA